MKPLTVSIALVLATAFYLLPPSEVERAPGVLAPDDPRQNPVTAAEPWTAGKYRITPLATFSVRARVLLADRYWLGRESDLSPLDLTLGWGPLSDTARLRQFRIWRGHRCYYWQPRTPEAGQRAAEVTPHSANVHIIPAAETVKERLLSLRPGDLVELGGFLVEAESGDGWRWRSSLTRDDSGPGACELMWVEWIRPG